MFMKLGHKLSLKHISFIRILRRKKKVYISYIVRSGSQSGQLAFHNLRPLTRQF